ncbi:MAG: diguanylate cyclase [Mariniblastus sp.]|nr:diguanylate cyclase [Mariniblastus sp.]
MSSTTPDKPYDRIDSALNAAPTEVGATPTHASGILGDALSFFQTTLLKESREGVIFLDPNCVVVDWNLSAEKLTGLSHSMMLGKVLKPTTLTLSTPNGQLIANARCPFLHAIKAGKKVIETYSLLGRSGRKLIVELSITPIITRVGDLIQNQGAVVRVHDASEQVHLRERLSQLTKDSSIDPLTQVANRATFEKTIDQYVSLHRQAGSQCSLILCDIDFFKQINDTFGHHIGDQALVAFARLLKDFVRSRDLVARYGGEEFVILCANCDMESARKRAETIRDSLQNWPQQMLNGQTITASFGISQLVQNDSATDFFIRADEALYRAKKQGRNRVMISERKTSRPAPNQLGITDSTSPNFDGKHVLFAGEFVSNTPTYLVGQKITGFMNATGAKLLDCCQDFVSALVQAQDPSNSKRRQTFQVEIKLSDAGCDSSGNPRTRIRLLIQPPKKKMFKRLNSDLYMRIVLDFRRYLMISEDGPNTHIFVGDKQIN